MPLSVPRSPLSQGFSEVSLKFMFVLAGGINIFRTVCLILLKMSRLCCRGRNVHKNRRGLEGLDSHSEQLQDGDNHSGYSETVYSDADSIPDGGTLQFPYGLSV